MVAGRQADSARRRQRVLTAIDHAPAAANRDQRPGIARAAGVDRTFLYRHRDLLEQIHAAEPNRPPPPGSGPAVTRASLQADLLAAHQRCARMNARVQQLETRLSELLGEQAWRDPDSARPPTSTAPARSPPRTASRRPAAPARERDEELAAARAANRELMTRLNARHPGDKSGPTCTTHVAHGNIINNSL